MSVQRAYRASIRTAVHRIACRDTGNTCDACFEGRNDDRLVVKAVEHLAQEHGAPLTSELAAQVRQLIRPI